MDSNLTIIAIVLGASIVMQYWAAGISFSLIREIEHRSSWLLIALAITLMALRRTVSLIGIFNANSPELPSLSAEIIALATSVLMLMGLLQMKPHFSRLQDGYKDLVYHTKQIYKLNSELERFNFFVARNIHVPCRLAASSAHHLENELLPKLEGEERKHLETVTSKCRQIKDLADKLLLHANANSRSYQRETINLSEVAERVAVQIKAQFPERNITFEIEEDIFVMADPVLLRGALESLLDNSVKFTSHTPNARISIGTASRGKGENYIYVRDNGVGIDDLERQNIFKPFVTLRTYRDLEGPGLGLSVVSAIVRSHNGKIWAVNNEEGGMTVCFTMGQEV